MANSARQLLNYVDEHKQEMKDDTYKGIVDRLAPINNELENNKKTKYDVFFMFTNIRREPHDETMCIADYTIRKVQVFLSKTDVDFINNELNTNGQVTQICAKDERSSQGLHTLETTRRLFCRSFETITIRCDISDDNDEIEWKDIEYMYSNYVAITRIKKVE